MEVEHAVQQAEAILRFAQELDRRLAEHGIAGVADFLQRYAQFQKALAAVSLRELQRVGTEAEQLARRLQHMCAELRHLSALKVALEVQH